LISGQSPFQSEKLERINHKILNKPIHFMDEEWFQVSVEAKKFIL
jgi:hypothetical protein